MKHFRKVLTTTLGITAIAGGMFTNIYPGLSNVHADNRAEVKVEKGQDIQSLAQEYRLDVNSLMQKNHLTSTEVDEPKTLSLQDVAQNKNPFAINMKLKTKTSDDKVKLHFNIRRSSETKAKKWIAFHESTNSYHAQNGYYYGKYQLGRHLLRGNYSASNQEKTANRYVKHRYGSWVNAKSHWLIYNWY